MNNLVLFDGSNFHNRVRELCPGIQLHSLRFRRLAKYLTIAGDNRLVYCVGEVKQYRENPKSIELYASQQRLFGTLLRDRVVIKPGFLQYDHGVYHEKGVDVQIATEMLRGAFKDEFDRCYLVSSDSDLLPAIREVRAAGKQVIYVCLEHFIRRILSANCSGTFVITKKILRRCMKISVREVSLAL